MYTREVVKIHLHYAEQANISPTLGDGKQRINLAPLCFLAPSAGAPLYFRELAAPRCRTSMNSSWPSTPRASYSSVTSFGARRPARLKCDVSTSANSSCLQHTVADRSRQGSHASSAAAVPPRFHQRTCGCTDGGTCTEIRGTYPRCSRRHWKW